MRASTSADAITRTRRVILGLGLVIGLSLTAAAAPAQADPITDVVKKVAKKVDRVTKPTTKKTKAATKKVTGPVRRTAPVTRRAPARSTTTTVRNATAPLAPGRRVVNQRVVDGSQLSPVAPPPRAVVRVVRVTTRNLAKPVIFGTPPVVDLDGLLDRLDRVLPGRPDPSKPVLPGTPPLLPEPGGPAGPPAADLGLVTTTKNPGAGTAAPAARNDSGSSASPTTRPGSGDAGPSSSVATAIAFLLSGRPLTETQSTSTYTWAAYLVLTAGAVTAVSLGATGAANAPFPVFAGAAYCATDVRRARPWRMPRVTRAGPTPVGTTPPEPGFAPD